MSSEPTPEPVRSPKLRCRKSSGTSNALLTFTFQALPHPNIIVFGKTGAGKSSLINMIAGKDVAPTSSGLPRCTLDIKSYDVKLDDSLTVTLWDTVGLDQVDPDDNIHTISGDAVCKLIRRLGKGLILLIFCFRGRIKGTFEEYHMFRKLCHTVPMAVVVSGLEKEPDKVKWWSRNEIHFTNAGLKFDHHACVEGIKENSVVYGEAYDASAKEVKAMINRACRTNSTNPMPLPAPQNVCSAKLGHRNSSSTAKPSLTSHVAGTSTPKYHCVWTDRVREELPH